jgi:ABC-2 type transport system ATP-binding protein
MSTGTRTASLPENAPAGRSTPAITAEGLTKTYARTVRALDGLSLSVPAGTVFALLGPNGAGKSTTIKVLTTLTRPDAGSARVAGIDVLAHPDRVRRAIGCVFQKPQFDPVATGRENLHLQGRLHGIPWRQLKERVQALLTRFRLDEAADRPARTYSGGMQRKLDIALGLVHRPTVLFLDEPTTGLDPEARAEMWREIDGLARDGLTVVLTTHYLDEADQLAHTLAIVDRGRVVARGTPDQLKSELAGDAIQVELTHPAADGQVHTALGRLGGLRDVVVDGTGVRARADEAARAVPGVLAALEGVGLGVASVTVSRPSLDDVYLRYAGRAFATADAVVRS